MNFFSQQSKAIKQTRLLVGLFFVAIVLIIAAINAIFYFAYSTQTTIEQGNWFSQNYWIYISAGTLGLIVLTSLFRTWQINSNPAAIISMVDATYVSLSTKISKEKQLVNLVEEMAIASGMPIPQIFIMKNEQGLNAFVSGLKASAAILVVTQGLLDQLSRQQMQGVIGHEFSHILNGDMRLNLRLMGVIAGILVIGQLGQVLLRTGSYGRHSYFRFSSSRGKKSGGGIVAVGVGLLVVGYVGLFFGRMIKAAISRQREYLADASAVQFTRDREGIAGALLSIKRASYGSQLNIKSAEEVSHMCFGASTKISHKINGWLASHPPLDDRIQAIFPGFARMKAAEISKNQRSNDNFGIGSKSNAKTASNFSGSQGNVSNFTGVTSHNSNSNSNSNINPSLTPPTNSSSVHSDLALDVTRNIGNACPENIERAQKLLHRLPKNLVLASRGASLEASPFQMILLLFLAANEIKIIAGGKITIDDLKAEFAAQLFEEIFQLNRASRHALFDLAMARIEKLPVEQKLKLFDRVKKITKIHAHLTPNGLAIYSAVANKVKPTKPYQKFFNHYSAVSQSLNVFFYHLLQENNYQNTQWDNADQHRRSILKLFGAKTSDNNKDHTPVYTPVGFHNALNQMARLNPRLKEQLVLNVVDAIQIDNKIEEKEYDFLRLLCEYMDCPIPLN